MALLATLALPAKPRPEASAGSLIEGTAVGELIAERKRAVAASLADEDQARREQGFADAIDKLMTAELESEMARTWPSDEMRERYRQEFKAFRKWCDTCGVGALPAKGSTVAAYLACSASDGADKAWFPLAANAIRFVHDASRHYLDDVPIAAALVWASKLDEPPAASVDLPVTLN
jgi:hypothetical protein